MLAFAKDSDPFQVLTAKVRDFTFHGFESGWSGPPYDPFALAAIWGIEVSPNKDVVDARIVPAKGGTLRIEFNPDRPTARINYSVAHELGHSLFPDCAEIIRHRVKHSGATRDEWQLEMLCNIAAAEILMPIGALREEDLEPDIDRLLDLREGVRRFKRGRAVEGLAADTQKTVWGLWRVRNQTPLQVGTWWTMRSVRARVRQRSIRGVRYSV